MTILVGFSASRQSDAPINLATRIARNSGETVVAAAIAERGRPPKVDPVEDAYLSYLTAEARKSLERVVEEVRGELEIPIVIHESTSVPAGLLELAAEHRASVVVVGSSSSGLLGRVALGSVTDRLVHTAALPVAIAPRSYPTTPKPLSRITAAYGGDADLPACSLPRPTSRRGGRCRCGSRRSRRGPGGSAPRSRRRPSTSSCRNGRNA